MENQLKTTLECERKEQSLIVEQLKEDLIRSKNEIVALKKANSFEDALKSHILREETLQNKLEAKEEEILKMKDQSFEDLQRIAALKE